MSQKIMRFLLRSHILLPMKRIKMLLIVGNIALVLATLLALCAPYEAFQGSGIAPILGLTYPAMLIAHGVFALLWGILRSKWFVLSLLMIAMGQILYPQVLKLWKPFYGEVSETLHIATFNAQFISLSNSNGNVQISGEIEAYLDADILCLQECSSATKEFVLQNTEFPHAIHYVNTTVALLSKYPILASGQVNMATNPANVILWANVLVQKDTIRVYSAHLESNRISGEIPTDVVIDAHEVINLGAYFGILKHYSKFSNLRIIQAQEIKNHMAACSYPVVICGDMNDSPMSRVYKVLSDDMQDAWDAGGFGFGTTLDTWVPGMRIDHVFVNEDWNVLNYSITPVEFSDHHIVRTELELK